MKRNVVVSLSRVEGDYAQYPWKEIERLSSAVEIEDTADGIRQFIMGDRLAGWFKKYRLTGIPTTFDIESRILDNNKYHLWHIGMLIFIDSLDGNVGYSIAIKEV